MRKLDWVIRGNETRRSRIRDYEGRLPPVTALFDLPLVLWQASNRRFGGGRRPVLPWIPYPAIRRLQRLIQPQWHALESGSGNSTIWLATRVAYLRSMESDRGWYERIRPQLPSNVVYQWIDMHATPEQYWEITDGEVGRYDLVLVDGMLRDYCIRSAIHAVRPGGYVYLDNIDSTGRAAFPILRDAVKARGGSLELLTGFPPAQPTITTGALAHF